jgi:anti-anti-sigma factor
LTITSESTEGATVVHVTGRMDAVAAPQFEQACAQWIGTGASKLVIDFTNLDYISSGGLRAILSAGKALHAGGGALALSGPEGVVKNVLTVAGFCSLFPVFDSVEAALERL